MPDVYGRDLDLNLLRVFAVVAEAGSVTAAASRLYITQPAVSAALRRLQTATGAPLFVRAGRGLALTARGEQLRARVQPHLQALVDAALVPAQFDPRTSERTFRLGVSDSGFTWLLSPLLRVIDREAPGMRVIAVPVQFRNIAAAFAAGPAGAQLDAAVLVADSLPATIRRAPLFTGGFVCLHDPRHTRFKRLTEASYFEHEHVVVSYNADTRGIVEDYLRRQRRVRCSIPSFSHIGELVEGTALLATVPRTVATEVVRLHPRLAMTRLPFRIPAGTMELLWPAAADDDEPGRWLRAKITRLAKGTSVR
ncbi:MAG TPA: LysR family transcriptional regulator [Kofleriaceae bacterium]|nr:LysR family transcriptional regulator [Kofleriaceae bacterium]